MNVCVGVKWGGQSRDGRGGRMGRKSLQRCMGGGHCMDGEEVSAGCMGRRSLHGWGGGQCGVHGEEGWGGGSLTTQPCPGDVHLGKRTLSKS